MEHQPKVLIVTTIYESKEYALETFMKHCSEITYPNLDQIYIDNSADETFANKLRSKGLNVIWVGRGYNSREALGRSTNVGLRKAQEGGYDYMFSLESDVYCPPDIIQNLMAHREYVVSGWYNIGDRSQGVRVPCITVYYRNPNLPALGTRLLQPDEYNEFLNKGLKQVAAGSFGCCLIDLRLFKEFPDITFHYDQRLSGHPDVWFFNSCFRRHVPVWVDTNIYCEHENVPWSEVKDR